MRRDPRQLRDHPTSPAGLLRFERGSLRADRDRGCRVPANPLRPRRRRLFARDREASLLSREAWTRTPPNPQLDTGQTRGKSIAGTSYRLRPTGYHLPPTTQERHPINSYAPRTALEPGNTRSVCAGVRSKVAAIAAFNTARVSSVGFRSRPSYNARSPRPGQSV